MLTRDEHTRIWVLSDVQSDDTNEVERCLGTAIDDLDRLDGEFDRIWYLGDGVRGTDLDAIRRVTETQLELLEGLNVPVRYVMGNHDLDYTKATGDVTLPLYEAVQSRSGWRTTDDPSAFYFLEELETHVVVFLSDHVAPDGSWSVTHGRIHGAADQYPHSETAYREAIERATETDKPILIAGHNAFPGGNRPAEIQRRLFPLPESVLAHVYGHAHIGDERIADRKAYRTISHVDHHDIPQVNVASIEDRRGDTVRSAVLELSTDGGIRIRIRDHSDRSWIEEYSRGARSRRYTVRLYGEGDSEPIESFSHRTQNRQLAAVGEYLATEHRLTERIDVPYETPWTGTFVDDTPEATDGSGMDQPYELPDGYYMERSFDKGVKRRALERLAQECGLAIEFEDLW